MAKPPQTAAPAAEKPAASAAPPAPEAAKKPAASAAPPAPEAAKKPAASAAPAERKPLAPISVTRWSEAAFKQARHSITPEAETPVVDLANPAYYAHIAPKLNPGDIVEVRPADGSYYLELYVWARGSNWAHVSPLQMVERPKLVELPAANAAFSIEFVDGAAKYRVIRVSDRAELARGFETPEVANAWLEGNKGRLAA